MILFAARLASAQEQACAPTPLDRVEADLAAAERALGVPDLEAARAALDAAREHARCLSAPVPPLALGRLAWDLAELGAFEGDEEQVWPWVRLAREVGVAEPPERAARALLDLLVEAPEPAPVSGPSGVRLYEPKKGAVYADGKVLAAPRLSLSTPHLVQVFDRDAIYLSSWVTGANFPAVLLNPEVQEGQRVRATGAEVELPPRGWKPAKVGTEAAYREWLREHPDGPWKQEALDAIDDLRWAAAQQLGTELAAKQYLHDVPDGLHVDEARFAIEHLAYLRVMEAPSRAAWEKFLAEAPPDGAYASEARVQLDFLDWTDARAADTSAAYRAYLEHHPDGRNAARAAELEEERALDQARAKHTDTALRDFLDRWPNGSFAAEARAILGGVRFDAVTLSVSGPADPAVRARIDALLRAELAKRGIPLATTPGEGTARLEVWAEVRPNKADTDIVAKLALQHGELRRPLLTLDIASKMLAGDDAGQQLGSLLVTNLESFDRWRKPR